ncbi:hypothetical protein ACH5RR_038701 [Cinchona calisaya]|uniref:DUF7054 domain-containing protein n=1 Tax=Cinchona calisaya TaxID=153742 RepID=A0ABD2Y1N8_9GENT
MLLKKLQQKKNPPAGGGGKGNRFLISIDVLGSAGPIRFVVNEEELVADVIDTTLKSYAREGRLPLLGSDHYDIVDDFMLYCLCETFEALSPSDRIGSLGYRNFKLCKKPRSEKNNQEEVGKQKQKHYLPRLARKASWFNKLVTPKVSCH